MNDNNDEDKVKAAADVLCVTIAKFLQSLGGPELGRLAGFKLYGVMSKGDGFGKALCVSGYMTEAVGRVLDDPAFRRDAEVGPQVDVGQGEETKQ